MNLPVEHRIRGDRPGERLVAGIPLIFNLDALNTYEADATVAAGDPTAVGAFAAWISANRRHRGHPAVQAFGEAVHALRAQR